ncbi:hypothetical protein BDA99DRAFT_433479 [Phascolomyces articulosus]|uniref:Uncharacterized protein n=1 Tax=Phascolomyces articulosus TaxID=60185 RepID=A0AAD5KN43_9FUNG|nr:hypothetical protein BDA99DRAFT_433479 [Phascolomyces articulosus]
MPGKRKRTSNDAQWCLNNSNTLTVKDFAIEFGLTDRQYTVTRYRNILRAHFSRDRRESLLQDLDGWKKSLDAKNFWKEQARKQTIAETRVRCSAFVDAIIHEEGPKGSSIINDDSNNNVESSSSSSTNNRDRGTNINNSDDNNHNDRSISERNHNSSNNNINKLFNDDEFIKVTRIINEVAEKTKTIRTAKLELLTLAASMEGGNKASVVEGVANLLTKLPRVEILNMDKLGEVELQTTYYDALLSELIADQDKNVALRWPNKSTDEEQTDIRPDAIVSTIMQHDFGYPVGFGEVKPGNSSTTKHSVSLDVLRLGIASKRAIDKWKLNSCLGFMINGFDLTFFITKKQHKNCYTMLDIAQFTYASSLSNLHSFVSLMNLNKLTKVGRCFWNECHATHVTRDDEAGAMANDDAGVVPISELYALISRTRNRTLGTSSRY